MSKHEAELRRRLAGDHVDVYEIISWFLDAIDAQAYVDGKPGEPDLSWFEREFLINNIERYHTARIKRMSMVDLLNKMAIAKPQPGHPRIPCLALPLKTCPRRDGWIAVHFRGELLQGLPSPIFKNRTADWQS